MSPELVSSSVARTDLTPEDVREMFRVFNENFSGGTPALFEHDLENKNWVILLRDAQTGVLEGFSTLALYETCFHNQPISVVYSGDTIIRRAYWGTPELPRSWIKTVLARSVGMPQPLYWLLISSGYKTYRFLSVFYKEFYPCHSRPTPPEIQSLTDFLASERFGAEYDAAQGVVRFRDGATPLRDGVAAVTDDRLRDPDVAFFIERNPGHAQGDELVCLTRVHPENFTPAGRRMAR